MSTGTWTCARCGTSVTVGADVKRDGGPSPSLWVRISVATFGALQRQNKQPVVPKHFCPPCYPEWLREEAARLDPEGEMEERTLGEVLFGAGS